MSEEMGINLSCYRSNVDREEMLQKWKELSTYNTGKKKFSIFIFKL